MTEQEVVDLMLSSKTEAEWNDNSGTVKAACGGFPAFWYKAIIMSSVAEHTATRWNGSSEIHIVRVR